MAAQVTYPAGAEIIAHRGASHDAPENTLTAINLAWQQGADAVEIDIQLSKDGRIVVIHDDDTLRIGGVDRKVSDQTLAELRQLDAGGWKGSSWTGERFPTLDEVLTTVPAGKRLFIEVKCGLDFLPAFVDTCWRSGKTWKQIVPIGFSAPTMKELKNALPELEVSLVADFATEESSGLPVEDLIAAARGAGLDGLDLDGSGPIDAAVAAKVRAAKLKLYVWTVDSPERARELIKAGVEGITTNRPGWLREHLAILG